MPNSDPIAEWERLVDEAVGEISQWAKFAGREVINRPMYSEETPYDELLKRYAIARDDEEAIRQMTGSLGLGAESATKLYLRLEKDFQRQYGNQYAVPPEAG